MRRWQKRALNWLNWLEEHSRWHQLKTLGSSNLVRTSVLMPAFGYMLLLNDKIHQYLTIKYDGRLLDYLPSIWRIELLFYGSFLLAIATIVYAVTCPLEIKRYNSEFDMADAEAEHIQNLGRHSILFVETDRLWEKVSY